MEAYLPSWSREKGKGAWGFKGEEEDRQYIGRWEEWIFGKQVYAVPCPVMSLSDNQNYLW